jgi:hypothetical protein
MGVRHLIRTIPGENMNTRIALVAVALAAAFGWSSPALAHCDTLDGPVVAAARKALDSGNVQHALIWVQKDGEHEIRQAFDRARSVRRAGGAARDLADTYFNETLVRVHRAGEGAPFPGLKPAGMIEPPVAAADNAIATGKLEPVARMLRERTEAGLHAKYDAVLATRRFDTSDVDAGRKHVGAYVQYVHYVEGLYDAAAKADAHGDSPAAAHGAAPAAHAH